MGSLYAQRKLRDGDFLSLMMSVESTMSEGCASLRVFWIMWSQFTRTELGFLASQARSIATVLMLDGVQRLNWYEFILHTGTLQLNLLLNSGEHLATFLCVKKIYMSMTQYIFERYDTLSEPQLQYNLLWKFGLRGVVWHNLSKSSLVQLTCWIWRCKPLDMWMFGRWKLHGVASWLSVEYKTFSLPSERGDILV